MIAFLFHQVQSSESRIHTAVKPQSLKGDDARPPIQPPRKVSNFDGLRGAGWHDTRADTILRTARVRRAGRRIFGRDPPGPCLGCTVAGCGR